MISVPPLFPAPQTQPFPASSARSQLILHLCGQVTAGVPGVTAGMSKAVATGRRGRGEGTVTTGSSARLRWCWSCGRFSGQAESGGKCRSPINCGGITAICTGSALPSASSVPKTQPTGRPVAALRQGVVNPSSQGSPFLHYSSCSEWF